MAARMVMPLLVAAAAWTSLWIGPFYAGVLALWVFWAAGAAARRLPVEGPVLFRKAAFGERIWLNHLPKAARSEGAGDILVLYLTAWLGLAVTIFGGLFLSPILTATGLLVSCTSQYVCSRRLADFYRTQKNSHPLYRFWEFQPANDEQGHDANPWKEDGTVSSDRYQERHGPSVR
jgi:hypothetical protein